MDRQPEDPSPEDVVPEEPVSPYGPAKPAAGADPEPSDAEAPSPLPAPDSAPDEASPYQPSPAPPEEAAAPDAWQPPEAPPAAEVGRPGVGAGVATGCGLQVLGVIAFFLSLGVATFYGALWPFIVITVAAAALMFSRRWRRFATGVLIVSAATWIIVIGPCIALLSGALYSG